MLNIRNDMPTILIEKRFQLKEVQMKEYCENFLTENNDCRISVRTDKGKIILGTDIGVDGYFVELNKKETNQLINMLKLANKKVIE